MRISDEYSLLKWWSGTVSEHAGYCPWFVLFRFKFIFSYWELLGCLYMGSLVVNAPDKRERICIEVKEVVFLKSESSSLSSLSSPSKGLILPFLLKGKQTFFCLHSTGDLVSYWGTPSKATAIASPSPTPSPKKGHNAKGKVKEGGIYDDVLTDVDEDGSDKELASVIERSKRKRSTYYA
jgi:hypothetical protein